MKRLVTIVFSLLAAPATHVLAQPVLSMQRGGANYTFHLDHIGNTRVLTETAGAPVERIKYANYGDATLLNGIGQPVQSSPTGNPYRFRGMRFDEETGFYYCERTGRTYDPKTGRYICRGTAVGNPGDAVAARGNNPWSPGAGGPTMRPKGRGTSRADGGQEGSEVSGFNDVFTTILALMGSEANDFHGNNSLISILLPSLRRSEARNIDDAVAVINTLMGSEANDIAGPVGNGPKPLWGVDLTGAGLEGIGVRDWVEPPQLDDHLLIDTATGERAAAEAIVAAQIAAEAAAGHASCGIIGPIMMIYRLVKGLRNDDRFDDDDRDGWCNASDDYPNDRNRHITHESEGGMWFISGGAMGGWNGTYEIGTDGQPYLESMTMGHSYASRVAYTHWAQQKP